MPNLLHNRREFESSVLATISLISVACLRFPAASGYSFWAECVVIGLCFATIIATRKLSMAKVQFLCSATAILVPIATSIISRRVSYPIAYEMTAITIIGAASLIMAIGPRRVQAMSLVASGFLTLFATVISDFSATAIIAILWITICVWHLVANHWERIDLCSVENVRRRHGIRPLTVLLATSVFVLGGWMAKGRFGQPTLLQGGFMPVSGGSRWSDPGARSGVGMGEAAIAAKGTTDSVGAVDSEFFLESRELSLYDMFSDLLGDTTKKKIKRGKSQAMASDKVIEMHEKAAQSEKGGSSFSTSREAPKGHRHLESVKENAVVQWAGPSGIRLAMNRYDTFDGVEWTNQAAHRNRSLTRVDYGDQAWFFDPKTVTRVQRAERGQVQQGQLKILHLKTARLPVPMMTCGLNIQDIDRRDFYGIEEDGSFFMPDREKIPALTVVNVAHLQVMEDELIRIYGRQRSAKAKDATIAAMPYDEQLADLVDGWTVGCETKYDKLRGVLTHIRSEFQFDRSEEMKGPNPLDSFLSQRSGGDHLFATTAALMARHLGFESRLVTGFYVEPKTLDAVAQHHNILAEDVHVWAEIKLDGSRWIEIEPTPGYREPVYRPSFWLAAQRFARNHWPKFVASAVWASLLFVTRLIWIDWLLKIWWGVATIFGPRRRLGVAMKIIEFRARLLGRPRPKSTTPRDWLLNGLFAQDSLDASLKAQVESFCDFADLVCFGQAEHALAGKQYQPVVGSIVSQLRMTRLRKYFMDHKV